MPANGVRLEYYCSFIRQARADGAFFLFLSRALSGGVDFRNACRVTNTLTKGVRVEVESQYLSAQSDPSRDRFVFMYTVTITNESDETVQLLTRHWVITDAHDDVREVRGDGVVGQQPVLGPGESHQYQSGCILATTWGTMHGSYEFRRSNRSSFDAEIEPFLLAAPTVSTAREFN